ncbi:NYN domain-containing protein [Stieleria sp. TO1_6]|uniref:NYN domain-containing protein n=1 Tax=Stieleria tagensis TaxID=2956795 RepID=UPI00209AF16F|nr:NYN domain-containing protein [Stieleria tagensis]MCO8120353.1 NYN domain-containing protein [Stieleria tagensis]
MSLLLLIDGYNLSQPIAPARNPDPRWLEQNRNVLLRDLTTFLSESIRAQTCVVFDAANPPRDRPHQYAHQQIDVRFAVGYPSADDLLEELIRAHHSPKRLMVVSSDHRIQIAASRRGARHFDSEPWIDALTDGNVRLAVPTPVDPGGSDPGGSDLGGSDPGRPGQGGSGQGGHPSSADPTGSNGDQQRLERPRSRDEKPRVEDSEEVSQWMREFGFDPD